MDQHLEFYLEKIRRNHFLPVPPAERMFDGSNGQEDRYRQGGCDTLRALITQADLKNNSRILEIGSGIGRVAIPLTQWLTTGTYTGVEIVTHGVSWCIENISSKYPNFEFIHFDIHNEFYNPRGRGSIAETRYPFSDSSFDLIFLSSVFTHLNITDALAVLRETRRMLAPGGHLWATWFVVDTGMENTILKSCKIPITFDSKQGAYYASENLGTLAVAFKEQLIKNFYADCGYSIKILQRGEWCERRNIDGGFQDVIVATIL